MRRLLAAIALVIGLVGTSLAGTYAEKVKEIDIEAKTLTITDSNTKKDKTFSFDEEMKVKKQKKVGKKLELIDEKDGAKVVKAGTQVILNTSTKDGKEVITEIIIQTVGVTKKK
jgi:hypothetical protein